MNPQLVRFTFVVIFGILSELCYKMKMNIKGAFMATNCALILLSWILHESGVLK